MRAAAALRGGGRLAGELRSFATIGIGCTAAYAVLYTLLRDGGVPGLGANALALALTMGVNFAANRHFTFAGAGGPLAGYLLAYGLGLAASSAALALLLGALGHPHGLRDTGAAVGAGLVATAVRFALMRGWVFRSAQRGTA